MPWFITAICSRDDKGSHSRNTRTFGFYDTYNEAYIACAENRGSMCECLYDYLVMEHIESGIHPMVHSRLWWSWNLAHNRWDCMFDREPIEYIGITNWALG